ncbi:DUF4198 domain-containing protein [Shewanella intestini]|uniref:DUF4198 domain-containing protein n=1 Tax=Shewanella intestini TaxID=2017544 RepID=A0ABS5I0F5_9GAMM|nr:MULTISPECIES: DUF4198 domain-containing protein [Shewanella]MBR9726865.1 DUF4198 domain-containing protein [Shewanella intestini]MRG34569.1 DUF4198 domain-containing protein [Shewanella sp. XMDDZSB0408]
MITMWLISLMACSFGFYSQPASAHFLTYFPQKQVIDVGDNPQLTLPLRFTHPATQGPVMDLARPESVGYMLNGKKVDLSKQLTAETYQGKQSWRLPFTVKRPGTYAFYASQAPYFDVNEQVVITQHAKVFVDAFAAKSAWQQALHTPVEIIPLTQPFALWTNSVFSGRVLLHGKPAKNVPIEMEYFNRGEVKLPSDAWASLVVYTNDAGEFSVGLPHQGWWGLAAVVEDGSTVNVNGKAYPHEQDGVIWLQVNDMH